MKSRPSIHQLAYVVLVVVGCALVVAVLSSPSYAAPPVQERQTPTPTPTDPPEAAPTDTPVPTPTDTPTATPESDEPAPPTEQPTEDPGDTPPDDDNDDGSNDDGDDSDDDGSDSGPVCLSRVEGFVRGSDGAALPGQTVELSGSGWSTTWTTDSNGFFYFDGLCAGDLVVAALIDGQPTASTPVEVDGATDSVVEVTLQPGGGGAQPAPTNPPATATPRPESQPTATPQVIARLPRTGTTTTTRFLVVGLFAAALMVGIRVVRGRVQV